MNEYIHCKNCDKHFKPTTKGRETGFCSKFCMEEFAELGDGMGEDEEDENEV